MVERRSPKPSMRVQLLLPLPIVNKKPHAAFFVLDAQNSVIRLLTKRLTDRICLEKLIQQQVIVQFMAIHPKAQRLFHRFQIDAFEPILSRSNQQSQVLIRIG